MIVHQLLVICIAERVAQMQKNIQTPVERALFVGGQLRAGQQLVQRTQFFQIFAQRLGRSTSFIATWMAPFSSVRTSYIGMIAGWSSWGGDQRFAQQITLCVFRIGGVFGRWSAAPPCGGKRLSRAQRITLVSLPENMFSGS